SANQRRLHGGTTHGPRRGPASGIDDGAGAEGVDSARRISINRRGTVGRARNFREQAHWRARRGIRSSASRRTLEEDGPALRRLLRQVLARGSALVERSIHGEALERSRTGNRGPIQ